MQAQPDFKKGKYSRVCSVCFQSGMELLSIQEKEAIGAKKDRALLSTDLRTLQETVKENRQTLQKREAAYKDLKETYDNVLREKEEQEEQMSEMWKKSVQQPESVFAGPSKATASLPV